MLTQLFLKLAYAGSEWVLWLLMLLSFISIALIIERALFFRKTAIDAELLGTQLGEQFKAGNVRGAWQLVAETPVIECEVVAAGIGAMRQGAQSCGEAMASAKARERGSLDSRLVILGTIGSNAPFVGLLGTVLGIIKAAHDLSATTGGKSNPNAVMDGVFEALVATAVGLLVAIPAVVAFNYFQRQVKARMGQVDSLAHLVMTMASAEHRTSRAPATASATPAQTERVH